MPSSIRKPPPFDAAATASKLPEPARWLGGAALQGLYDVMAPDPNDISGVANPMATPLISIYKNAAGVPSRALRELGTKEFVDSMENAGVPALHQAAQELAERYPRVAAHIRMNPSRQPVQPTAFASMGIPRGQVKSPMGLQVSHKGVEAALHPELGIGDARETIAHEAVHAAQALGNKDLSPLYRDANKAVGYYYNPAEQTAKIRGRAARAGQHAGARPKREDVKSALKGLQDITKQTFVKDAPERTAAAKRIEDILRVRSTVGGPGQPAVRPSHDPVMIERMMKAFAKKEQP